MSNLVRMLIKVCVIINCAFNYSLIMFSTVQEEENVHSNNSVK